MSDLKLVREYVSTDANRNVRVIRVWSDGKVRMHGRHAQLCMSTGCSLPREGTAGKRAAMIAAAKKGADALNAISCFPWSVSNLEG